MRYITAVLVKKTGEIHLFLIYSAGPLRNVKDNIKDKTKENLKDN